MIKENISKKITMISLLAMIMVIYRHSYNIENNMNYFLESNTFISFTNLFIQSIISLGLTHMAVPIFFLISGFLLFQNYSLSAYKGKISKRFYTLLIPYLFWTTLAVLIYFILQSVPGVSHYFSGGLMKDFSMQELIIQTWVNPKNYPLWFLRDLMLLTIVSPLIFYFVKKSPKIFIIILSFLWFFRLIQSSTDISFFKTEPILFFSIGAYFAIVSDKILSIKVSNKLFIYLVFIYFLVLVLKAIFLTLYPNESEIFIITIMHNTSVLLGIATLWFLLDRYNFVQVSFLTSFTFLFYVFHEPALGILKKGSYAIFGKTPLTSLTSYLLIPILILMSLTILGIILKKYFSKTGSIITGNRL